MWTRIVLSPLTSWRACCNMRAHQGHLDFDAAWRQARLRGRPDEVPYLLHGHGRSGSPPSEGREE